MSCPHDGHRQPFPSGNPFRMIFPRHSRIPQKYAILLDSFEKKLDERFKSLVPSSESEMLCFTWMSIAMTSLSETHTDIKTLITDLQFPISDWDGRWMDLYLDNSVKLLDICISFNSEISRLDQSKLLLRYALHVIDSTEFPSRKPLMKIGTSLTDWMQQIESKNLKLESCFAILGALSQSLDLPKGKNSPKEKTLIRVPAMASQGVRMLLVLAVCVVAALPGMVAGARPVNGGGFTVVGGVFCDTCQAGFETPASTIVAGAKVRVECRDRETEVLKYAIDGASDNSGKYTIYVPGEHANEICESVLVSSPLHSCSTPLAGRERARVVLTHHNGVVSDRRVANNLGFRSDSVLAGCAQIMQVYQQSDD